jgi:hypothetical protein
MKPNTTNNPKFNNHWLLAIDIAFGIFIFGIVLYLIYMTMIIISYKLPHVFNVIVFWYLFLAEITYWFLSVVLFIMWWKDKLTKRFKTYWIIISLLIIPHIYVIFGMIMAGIAYGFS